MLHKSCVKSTKRCGGMRLSVGVHKQKCEEISAACQSHSLPSKSEQKEEQLCSCRGFFFFLGLLMGGGGVGGRLCGVEWGAGCGVVCCWCRAELHISHSVRLSRRSALKHA